jgi:NAD(P) transhydrogenase subunit alpha
MVPYHASQMYSKNIITFLLHLLGTSGGKDGAKQASLVLNQDDEITRETLLTRDGAVVHARIKELLG